MPQLESSLRHSEEPTCHHENSVCINEDPVCRT